MCVWSQISCWLWYRGWGAHILLCVCLLSDVCEKKVPVHTHQFFLKYIVYMLTVRKWGCESNRCNCTAQHLVYKWSVPSVWMSIKCVGSRKCRTMRAMQQLSEKTDNPRRQHTIKDSLWKNLDACFLSYFLSRFAGRLPARFLLVSLSSCFSSRLCSRFPSRSLWWD